MSLISVSKEELVLGQPLRWTVYDQHRNILMDTGEVLTTEAQLQSLMVRDPLRELSWGTASKTASTRSSSGVKSADMNPAKPQEDNYSFLDMKLRVGDRIQLQPPASMGPERYVVKLIGYVDQASVLVTPPLANGLRIPVRDGDKIVARVFTNQTAFGFDSTIEKVCKIPYDYLHLSYPSVVQGAIIRKSPRIKTKIITSVYKGGVINSESLHSAVIVNLSADGALISAREPLDQAPQLITLSFRINLHGVDAHLTIKAIIRNVVVDDEKEASDPLKCNHGVEFIDLQPADNMILQSLIYQQMIEQPHTLT